LCSGRPIGVAVGVADDNVDPSYLPRDFVQGAEAVGDELAFQEQVLGGVAQERQLGEDDQGCALLFGAGDEIQVLGRVGDDVAYGGVDLGQGDPHGWILGIMAQSAMIVFYFTYRGLRRWARISAALAFSASRRAETCFCRIQGKRSWCWR
jgi:hypothetical protein